MTATPGSDLVTAVLGQARSGPGHPAVKDLDRELTYEELVDEVGRRAAGLEARGVGEGDRVALYLPNSVDFVVAALATMWVGALFVPLAVTDPNARVDAIVADCSPVIVVTEAATKGGEEHGATSPAPDGPPRVPFSELATTGDTARSPRGGSPSNWPTPSTRRGRRARRRAC